MLSCINNTNSMSACNQHSESIVHMACRRSSIEVVEFMLMNGAVLDIVDDRGRNPLHDACWSIEPRFEVASLVMDTNLNLIMQSDCRGASPLAYVPKDHWIDWCAFLFHQKDKYWAMK